MQFDQIKNIIFDTFRKNLGYFLMTSLALAFSLIAAYALNMFIPGAFILIIFFLVIPLLGCMIINNVQYSAGKDYSLKDFYRGYRLTLLPGLHGAFRMIRSFVFALLIALGTFLLIYEVCSLFMNVIDPNLISALEKAKNQTEMVDIIQSFYEDPSSEKYLRLYSIFYLCSFGTGLFFFIQFVMKSVPIFYIQSNMACSKKDAIYMHNQVFPSYKKTHNKLIFRVCGLYYIIYPVTYIISGFIGWMLFKDVQYTVIFAMLLTLLASLPFLPLYLLCQDNLYRIYAPVYKMKAKALFEMALKNVDVDPRISDEQKEVVKNFYRNQLAEIEKMEKTEILTQLSPNDLAERDHKSSDDNDKKPD